MEQPPISFRDPPVTEVALGLQFAPLGMSTGHQGWFWNQYLGDEWPTATDAPPIPRHTESFSPNLAWPPIALQFQSRPTVRLQLQRAEGDRMVQIQDTRFIYNWIKKSGAYPRYHNLRPEFDKAFSSFCEFSERAKLAKPRVNQWEVTYINQIPAGPMWSSGREALQVFPGIIVCWCLPTRCNLRPSLVNGEAK